MKTVLFDLDDECKGIEQPSHQRWIPDRETHRDYSASAPLVASHEASNDRLGALSTCVRFIEGFGGFSLLKGRQIPSLNTAHSDV
jgi:hypothetical protein